MHPVLTDEKVIQVRFSETDPMGVVWHGNYVRYFEDGRESFGVRHDISYLHFYENKLLAPIVKLSSDYKRPLRYGDSAIIETKYIYTESAKLIFDYRILSLATKDVVATGRSTQVFTDDAGKLFLTRPPFYEKWLIAHGFEG
ncbi:MAG TPA: acyl-CoA thioesterase [Spirochaetota bacterium]